MTSKPQLTAVVEEAIRHVLLSEWDPIGVSQNPAARSEYDGYIEPLFRMLASSRTEDEIATYLHNVKVKEIGLFDGLFHMRRNREIARKLLAIKLDFRGAN